VPQNPAALFKHIVLSRKFGTFEHALVSGHVSEVDTEKVCPVDLVFLCPFFPYMTEYFKVSYF